MADPAPAALVVAIDGPVGVGKSSAARALARRLGVPYLETGAMYRALAVKALAAGVDPDAEQQVVGLLADLDLELELEPSGSFRVMLDGRDPGRRLYAADVADATSRLSVHPAVRRAMVERQRRAAARSGAVLEGRDIGSVVFPETPHKFYLDATPAVRAERRWHQLRRGGEDGPSLAEVEAAIRARDARDAGREASPLRRDASYTVIDTSHLTPEEVVERMLAAIDARRAASS